ncbi:hypothetical protein AVEN_219289-1 [Araneus ventricosus]|uniref:Uncharacterized protein n=1 Tax=Araneus ventricosus TaxID=182803 RepID=A0A4Y2BF65_ARAVE|nr:hypothetical protein AVEN_219289-1 [Araneus ventricosus]
MATRTPDLVPELLQRLSFTGPSMPRQDRGNTIYGYPAVFGKFSATIAPEQLPAHEMSLEALDGLRGDFLVYYRTTFFDLRPAFLMFLFSQKKSNDSFLSLHIHFEIS